MKARALPERFAEMPNRVHLNHEYVMIRGEEKRREYRKIACITKETEKAIRVTLTTTINRNYGKPQEVRTSHVWAPKKCSKLLGDWLEIEDWLKPDFEELLIRQTLFQLSPNI